MTGVRVALFKKLFNDDGSLVGIGFALTLPIFKLSSSKSGKNLFPAGVGAGICTCGVGGAATGSDFGASGCNKLSKLGIWLFNSLFIFFSSFLSSFWVD